jgi:hypothetical protein
MPDMDLSSMKEATKAKRSYCYWSPATGQAQETEIATEIEGWCAPSRHDPKVCREKCCRLGGQVKPATAAIKSKSPGANPGFPST